MSNEIKHISSVLGNEGFINGVNDNGVICIEECGQLWNSKSQRYNEITKFLDNSSIVGEGYKVYYSYDTSGWSHWCGAGACGSYWDNPRNCIFVLIDIEERFNLIESKRKFLDDIYSLVRELDFITYESQDSWG